MKARFKSKDLFFIAGEKEMKNIILTLVVVLSITGFASACTPEVTLVNQDPIHAIPGDYVKVVFQVSGLEASDCGTVNFWLDEKYPFSLDPGVDSKILLKSGTYTKDYGKYFLVPYSLRVDENALDGNAILTTKLSFTNSGNSPVTSKDFNVSIEDFKSDFEVYVKDYSYATKEITFGILNIGKNNVEALTLKVPEQNNMKIIGSNVVIIGSLDANGDDVAKFVGDVSKGLINLSITYTDQINVRRTINREVEFNPDLFKNTVPKKSTISPTLAFIIGLIIPMVFMYFRNKIRKKKEKMKKRGMATF